MIDRLTELLKAMNKAPEITCPRFNKQECKGCQFENGNACDVPAREANYLLSNGVIVPPCKVGDVVWLIGNMKIYTKEIICSRKVTSVQMLRTGELIMHFKDGCFSSDSVGVYVFFTKEEAEQALKGGVE